MDFSFDHFNSLVLLYNKGRMYKQAPIAIHKHVVSGRDKETQEIIAILKEISDGGPSKIVAITGPSGVGKV